MIADIKNNRAERELMITAIKMLMAGLMLGFAFEGAFAGNIHALGKHESERIEPLPDVLISPTVIAVPLERILLVRADTCNCALKFTKAYYQETHGEYLGEDFATYELWYQGDGTGDFSKSNVKFKKRDLWRKPPIGIGRLWLISRYQGDIQCGPIILRWATQTGIFWTPKKVGERVQTIYFAPTPWKSISEVDVHDSRITWYHQEPDRPRVRIPIDQLWR